MKRPARSFAFFVPNFCIGIRVARIKDVRIYARQFCRHNEVEVRNCFCRSFVDRSVENSIDDATRVANRNTFARSVPTGVDQICLCTDFFHSLHEFFRIFCRMQAQESSSKACRERRSRLCDATFRSCQFSRKSGKEVVFRLFRSKNRNRRKHAKRVCRKEDHLMSMRTFRYRLNDIVDMVDRVGNTRVFRNALVGEIDFAIGVDRDVSRSASRLIAL